VTLGERTDLGATPRGRRAPLAGPLAVAGCAVAGVAVVALWDPNQPGHYPTCPFLALTGWYCPGCGSLRALHALAHGDLATAWARNPALVVGACWLTWVWLRWLMSSVSDSRPGERPRGLTGGGYARFLPYVVAAFWVARNIPGWTILSPA
jgi:uncharacterized protein DUF2752